MTTISSSVAAQVRAVPSAKARNAALDRARTFITMLVLIHHSVIAYTHFGHTDRDSFLGFDCVVVFNDSFFMAAMFFLSGLFVWPSLRRKGTGWFLRDRLWRLGLPFMVCALILMPLAYYAVELRQHPDIAFAAFWWKTVTVCCAGMPAVPRPRPAMYTARKPEPWRASAPPKASAAVASEATGYRPPVASRARRSAQTITTATRTPTTSPIPIWRTSSSSASATP